MKKYVFLLSCLCANAQADDINSLAPVVDNSSYPTTAPAPNLNATPSPSALYEMMGRLDRLQTEVQKLTGKVEEQGNELAELKKNQGVVAADVDERLQSLEKGSSSTPASSTVSEQPVTEKAADPVVNSETPQTEPAPAEPESSNTANTPVTPTPVVTKQPEIQASGDEKQAYQQAYNALRSGHTDESITQFKTYLSQYATGGYVDAAYYWLGEAYRVKLENDSARETFNTVLQKYPSSAKVPDALLKLGYIEMEQKNTAKAKEYLTRVMTEFPNTPAAHSAEKKLTQLK